MKKRTHPGGFCYAVGNMDRPTIALVQAIQTGDAEALDELMLRYMPRVLRMVRQRLGPKLRQKLQSGDIVQGVFIRVLRNLEDFSPRSDATFANWVSRLVANELADKADYFSAQKRNMGVEKPIDAPIDDQGHGQELPDTKRRAIDSLCRLKEEHLVLEKCLDQLKSRERELIVMRDLSEMSFEEVGAELDLKSDAARIAYGRAKNNLTKIVQGLRKSSV